MQPISDGGCSTLFENHRRDCRYKGPLKVAPTVTATYGMGGNNTPFVVSVIETSETVHCYDIGEARLRTPSEYIEKSPTLRAEAHGNAPYVINKKKLLFTIQEATAPVKLLQESITKPLKTTQKHKCSHGITNCTATVQSTRCGAME